MPRRCCTLQRVRERVCTTVLSRKPRARGQIESGRLYARDPYGRELEISCRAFTYCAGGRYKPDRLTVFRVKRVFAAEENKKKNKKGSRPTLRNRCNKDS